MITALLPQPYYNFSNGRYFCIKLLCTDQNYTPGNHFKILVFASCQNPVFFPTKKEGDRMIHICFKMNKYFSGI